MSRPSITVVIPTYERASECRTAVLSVLAQTQADVCVVVVDDGSSDATALSDLTLIDPDRVVHVRQRRRGAPTARNLGASVAQTDWLAFLDSDDVVDPAWASTLEEQIDAETVLVTCAYRIQTAGDHLPERIRVPTSLAFFPDSPALFTSGTFIVRRETFLAAGGYLDGLEANQQHELLLRILRRASPHQVKAVAVPLMTYREGGEDNIRGDHGAVARALEAVYAAHRDLYNEFPAEAANLLGTAAIRHVRAGNLRKARLLLLASLRAQPFASSTWARLLVCCLPGVPKRIWHARGLRN